MIECGDIEPSEFDLIVVGTGFQEAVLAGAAAQAGKSVLHLDPAGSYGSHWASLRLDGLLDWAAAQQRRQLRCSQNDGPSSGSGSDNAGGGGGGGSGSTTAGPSPDAAAGANLSAAAGEVAVPAEGAAVYSHVSVRRDAETDVGAARDFSIDLAAKAALCAGPLVKALLASGAHNYVEFKALSSSCLWREGTLVPVPATRADIFAAEGLTLPQRRALTRFLTAAQAAMQGEGPLKDAFDGRPFAQLLMEQGLGPDVRALLLYAVAMLETDQEPGPTSPTPMPLAALPPAARAAAAAAAAMATAAQPAASPAQPAAPSAVGAPPASAAESAAHPAAAAGGGAVGPAPAAAVGQVGAEHAAEAAAANPAFGGGIATAAQGLEALRLYVESAGKYGPGTGAFLLPYYGTGELPQAFCRVAAVAGALYVLRRPVSAVLLDPRPPNPGPANPGVAAVRGVRLASGQELRCGALAGDVDAFADPQQHQQQQHLWRQQGGSSSEGGDGCSGSAAGSVAFPAAIGTAADSVAAAAVGAGVSGGICSAVARAVAVTDSPLQQGSGAALIVFPPRSLPSGNPAVVRVLQVGPGTAATPQGRFLLYATTAAGDAAASGSPPPGLRDVEEALAALVQLPPPATPQQRRQPAAQGDVGGSGSQQGGSQESAHGSGSPAEQQPRQQPAGPPAAEADGRPRALLLASFVQSTAAIPEALLPSNAACSAPPDGSLDFRSALAAAQAAFAKLFPEAAAARGGTLFGPVQNVTDDDANAAEGQEGAAANGSAGGGGGGGDDSDDDTLAALEAALAGIGGGDVQNGVPGGAAPH